MNEYEVLCIVVMLFIVKVTVVLVCISRRIEKRLKSLECVLGSFTTDAQTNQDYISKTDCENKQVPVNTIRHNIPDKQT